MPKKLIAVGLVVITLVAAWGPGARAAVTDDFTGLVAELQTRVDALSGSSDKTDRKQAKAAQKAIGIIEKSTKSLASDIKAAGKAAKKLRKAFPGDFAMAPAAAAPTLGELLRAAFEALAADVGAEVDDLSSAIDRLEEGADRDKASGDLEKAEAALTSALAAIAAADYPTAVVQLGRAFTAMLKGRKIAGDGGGGSCPTVATTTVTMSLDGAPWSASGFLAGGDYTPSTGRFNFGGTRDPQGDAFGLIVGSGVTGKGTYSTGISGSYTIGSPPTQVFDITSGTVVVDGLDVAGHTACGTFSFTASDGGTTVTAMSGTFALPLLEVMP